MSQFGKTLFSGSRFIFWTLAPFLILFAIVMPLSTTDWNAIKVIVVSGMDLTAVLLVFGLYNTRRFWLALRGVTAIVFCVSVACLVGEIIRTKGSVSYHGLISGDQPWRAFEAFIVIGIPCFVYTVFGKFSRKETDDDKNVEKETSA
jgi:hypothetical protein